jgi:hypothetical protein
MNGTGRTICAFMITPATALFACRTGHMVDDARCIWRTSDIDRYISRGIAS